MIRSETDFKNSIVTTVSKQIAAGRNKGLRSGREAPAALRAGGLGLGQGHEQSDSRDKRKMNTLAVYFEKRTKRKGFLVNFLSKEGKKKKIRDERWFSFVFYSSS